MLARVRWKALLRYTSSVRPYLCNTTLDFLAPVSTTRAVAQWLKRKQGLKAQNIKWPHFSLEIPNSRQRLAWRLWPILAPLGWGRGERFKLLTRERHRYHALIATLLKIKMASRRVPERLWSSLANLQPCRLSSRNVAVMAMMELQQRLG